MNRFLKPVLAGATLLTLAVPAMASAQPYDGGRAYRADRGDYSRSYRHDGARDYGYDRRWDRESRYRHDWRYRYWRHHRHWRDGWYDGRWR